MEKAVIYFGNGLIDMFGNEVMESLPQWMGGYLYISEKQHMERDLRNILQTATKTDE